MTDESTSTETEQTEVVNESEDSTTTDEVATEEQAEAKRVEELPDWAQTLIREARQEAADRRVALRNAEAALQNAKSPEDYAALQQSIQKLEIDLARTTVANKYGLPDVLAARLQGSTAEEMEADAKLLQAFANPGRVNDLSGGLDPTDQGDSDPEDPIELARKYSSRRRRG